MIAVEAAILKVLEERGIKPDVAAGLSLGEYGAIIAAGAVRPEEAFAIVRRRGIYMQEAVPQGGAMAAVMGADTGIIEEVCAQTEGTVSIANYNCPGQIVITGEADAVAKAGEALKARGARRIVPLKVSGPFHSCLLEGAGERLRKDLDKAQFGELAIPYVANLTAEYVTNTGDIKDLLQKQVSSPVKWQQSVEQMIAGGVDTFVEIGPGKTLCGFVKKIDKQARVLSVDKYEDLAVCMEALANA